MVLPTPAAGRKGLVSFRLFGFPVTIHTSFVLIVLLLGYSAPTGVSGAVVWLVVVTVSVIAHELGHAFVARPAGGEPRIDLYAIAGLTTWQPGQAGRGRRIAVSVAGPAAGVLFGIAVLYAYRLVDPAPATLLDDAFRGAILVNLFWGLANLLPMLPLDGGQVVLALMPGRDDAARVYRASVASIGVGLAVAAGCVAIGQPITAAFVVFIGAGNVSRVVALRRGLPPAVRALAAADEELQRGDAEAALRAVPDEVPEEHRVFAATLRSIALLRLGRAREAQAALLDLPSGAIEPVYEATVLLANGQDRLAYERLPALLATDPWPWAVRELALELRRQDRDLVAVVGSVTGAAAAGVLDALYLTGDYAAAAAWGERALATGAPGPAVAYNTACAYARAGDMERGIRALRYAADLGWRDLDAAESDGDLSALRDRPEWPEIRDRMAQNAGLGPSRKGG